MMLYRLTMTLATNHSSTMGAKVKPTLLVPKCWPANRSTKIAQVTPTMVPASEGKVRAGTSVLMQVM